MQITDDKKRVTYWTIKCRRIANDLVRKRALRMDRTDERLIG